jgi:hypothetical protein
MVNADLVFDDRLKTFEKKLRCRNNPLRTELIGTNATKRTLIQIKLSWATYAASTHERAG